VPAQLWNYCHPVLPFQYSGRCVPILPPVQLENRKNAKSYRKSHEGKSDTWGRLSGLPAAWKAAPRAAFATMQKIFAPLR